LSGQCTGIWTEDGSEWFAFRAEVRLVLPIVRAWRADADISLPLMFSSRLPVSIAPNAVSQAVAAARDAGRVILDLTETNPTVSGFGYPEHLMAPMADERALVYTPAPLGLESAREAVAAHYAAAGIEARQIALTASTSEAYSFVFKILCNAGDDVLVPLPSYPLFDLLTHLDGVRQATYRLDPAGRWCIDRPSLERAISNRSRAVLVVTPNNPTGSRLSALDREWLVEVAQAYELALISDEVFADYVLSPRSDAASLAGERRVLTFTLGGLSKTVGLPQMKLAWIAVSGPESVASEALDRLAIVADSYLSTSTSVQLAAPALLEAGRLTQALIHARLARNLAILRHAVAEAPQFSIFEPEGGWSVVMRVPALWNDERLVLRLLADAGVLVHPGYFFDIEGEGNVVLSLLTPPEIFDEGIARIIAHVSAGDGP
jgi:alanine-synthesizing transaminase